MNCKKCGSPLLYASGQLVCCKTTCKLYNKEQ